jgi:uncharacterized protein YndB with AHSA1/START domain
MTHPADTANTRALRHPAPLRVSRTFKARRETVFEAWSSADHVKNWFSPATYAVSEATVEMRVGGPFEFCMLAPSGEKHWICGVFVDVAPHSRLVIDMHVTCSEGRPLFGAYTEVNFADVLGGTRMDVVQSYTVVDAAIAISMIGGAAEGWQTTLDKLGREIFRMSGAVDMEARSVVHASFHLERLYDALPERVWVALTDPLAKAKWFGRPSDEWEPLERHMDVREGGREIARGRFKSGMVSVVEATYHDVVAPQRLVYSYVMHLDEKKISISLATIELKDESGQTRLMFTEQVVFLDGYDNAGSREHGTAHLLDELGASLHG